MAWILTQFVMCCGKSERGRTWDAQLLKKILNANVIIDLYNEDSPIVIYTYNIV